jgi:hypothetical protein
MKLAQVAVVQPRDSSSKSQHSSMSCSTAYSVAILPDLILAVGPEKSCMKVSTHALSLEQACENDINTTLTLSKHAVVVVPVVQVTWSTVEINSHEVILGDHPSVSSGAPFTIEWTAFESVKLTVADYEECKPHHRSPQAMLIPAAVRQAWLLNQGYSLRELEITHRKIHTIQELRRLSARERVQVFRVKKFFWNKKK